MRAFYAKENISLAQPYPSFFYFEKLARMFSTQLNSALYKNRLIFYAQILYDLLCSKSMFISYIKQKKMVKHTQYIIRRLIFRIPSIRTVYHGSESISFLGPKIWNILPYEIKQQTSLNIISNCSCRLCEVYINGGGFLSQLS